MERVKSNEHKVKKIGGHTMKASIFNFFYLIYIIQLEY